MAKDTTGIDFSKCVGFKYDPVPVDPNLPYTNAGVLEQARNSIVRQLNRRGTKRAALTLRTAYSHF